MEFGAGPGNYNPIPGLPLGLKEDFIKITAVSQTIP
jgi:hypothetical protein